MIAEEIAEALAAAGAVPVGPVPTVGEALRLAAAETRIDCALLDVNLGHEAIWPAVDALMARGVPMVLATGYDARALPPAYYHLPRCEKPTSGRRLVLALSRVLERQGQSAG